VTALALSLLIQRALGVRSRWHDYIRCVPSDVLTSLPAHFSDSRLQMLEDPKEIHYALTMRKYYDRMFRDLLPLLSSVLQQHQVSQDALDRTLAHSSFLWAMGFVESRSRHFRGYRYVVPGVDFAEVAFPDHMLQAAAGAHIAESPLSLHTVDNQTYVSFAAMTAQTKSEHVRDITEQSMPSSLKLQHFGIMAVLNGFAADCEPISLSLFPAALRGMRLSDLSAREAKKDWSLVLRALGLPQSDFSTCIGPHAFQHPLHNLALTLARASIPELKACARAISNSTQVQDMQFTTSADKITAATSCFAAMSSARLDAQVEQHQARLSKGSLLSADGAAHLQKRIRAHLSRYSTSARQDVAALLASTSACEGAGDPIIHQHSHCAADMHLQVALKRRLRRKQILESAAMHLDAHQGRQQAGPPEPAPHNPQRVPISTVVQIQTTLLHVATILTMSLPKSMPGARGIAVQLTFRRTGRDHTQWLGIIPHQEPHKTTARSTTTPPRENFSYRLCSASPASSCWPAASQVGIVSSPSDLLGGWDAEGLSHSEHAETTAHPNRHWNQALECVYLQSSTQSADVLGCLLEQTNLAVDTAVQCRSHTDNCASQELDAAAMSRIIMEVWGAHNDGMRDEALIGALAQSWSCGERASRKTSTQVPRETLEHIFVSRFSVFVRGRPYFTLISLLASECSQQPVANVKIDVAGSSLFLEYLSPQVGSTSSTGSVIVSTGQPMQIVTRTVRAALSVPPMVTLRLTSQIDHPGLSQLAARLWAASAPLLGPIQFNIPAEVNASKLVSLINPWTSDFPGSEATLLHSAAWRSHEFETYLHYLGTHQQLTTSQSAIQCHKVLLQMYSRLLIELSKQAAGSACCTQSPGDEHIANNNVLGRDTPGISLSRAFTEASKSAHQPAICVLPPPGCTLPAEHDPMDSTFKEVPTAKFCAICFDAMGAAANDRPILI